MKMRDFIEKGIAGIDDEMILEAAEHQPARATSAPIYVIDRGNDTLRNLMTVAACIVFVVAFTAGFIFLRGTITPPHPGDSVTESETKEPETTPPPETETETETEEPEGEFTNQNYVYELKDSEITILKYIGEASTLNMSKTIDGYPITKIAAKAFADVTYLESVTVSDAVTELGDMAFHGCSKLAQINIPESVTFIGKDCFDGTEWYRQASDMIVINDGVYDFKGTDFNNLRFNGYFIYPNAFEGRTDFKQAVFTTPCTVGDYAFANCPNINLISMGDGIFYSGAYRYYEFGVGAFANCTGVRYLELKPSVKTISPYMFSGCGALRSARIQSVEIGEYAFADCKMLEEITLFNTVTTICDSAFANCESLKRIYFTGTEEEFEKITVGDGNSAFLSADVVFTDNIQLRSLNVSALPEVEAFIKECTDTSDPGNCNYIEISPFRESVDDKIYIIVALDAMNSDGNEMYGEFEIDLINNTAKELARYTYEQYWELVYGTRYNVSEKYYDSDYVLVYDDIDTAKKNIWVIYKSSGKKIMVDEEFNQADLEAYLKENPDVDPFDAEILIESVYNVQVWNDRYLYYECLSSDGLGHGLISGMLYDLKEQKHVKFNGGRLIAMSDERLFVKFYPYHAQMNEGVYCMEYSENASKLEFARNEVLSNLFDSFWYIWFNTYVSDDGNYMAIWTDADDFTDGGDFMPDFPGNYLLFSLKDQSLISFASMGECEMFLAGSDWLIIYNSESHPGRFAYATDKTIYFLPLP